MLKERRYLINFADYFADALDRLHPLVEDGLVRVEADRITATSRGRLLLRNIAMCFDRYLHQPDAPATPEPAVAPALSRVSARAASRWPLYAGVAAAGAQSRQPFRE